MIPGTADCRSFISFFDLRTSGEEKQKGSREGQMSTVPVVVEGDAASENMFSAPPLHPPQGRDGVSEDLSQGRVQLLYPGLAHTGFNWT